ncbi:hypothetical protein [Glycomyces sp. NPDC048151]|uniref:hypothetical protein n=1 Tax=Glycomyces sp. NPDC048151 TaxID=3364002 RepID=UPI003720E80F
MSRKPRSQNRPKHASPYSTGGGGTVFEQQYGAIVLSHMLTAEPIDELGGEVAPVEVTFQAKGLTPVDDLLIRGLLPDGTFMSVSIGVRRNPIFVPSDESTVKLIGTYLEALNLHQGEIEDGRWILALVVASPNSQVKEIRELARIARDSKDCTQFRNKILSGEASNQGVRGRLVQFEKIVEKARAENSSSKHQQETLELAWKLLAALRVRELRAEGVDQSDRTNAVARLQNIVNEGTSTQAAQLYSKLYELVGRYAPAAATKSTVSIRRDLVGFPFAGEARDEPIESDNRTFLSSQAAVRSDYQAVVRRIAPVSLRERESELSELRNFCISENNERYFWWRGPAWAGKSALLASFVLNPPPRIRIVSFFVTARSAGQSNVSSFTEVILEQVLELLGEPMPVLLTEATREAHLAGSLERAAKLCTEQGERLVLVVDGLDEDTGVTVGPDNHSIAAALPNDPDGEIRVVIASRPNPPIPSDVPDDHPIRMPEIRHDLRPSSFADVVRQDAERELKRLFHGSEIEQDLLGLLVAAGGGLTGRDLAELTDLSEWEIEEQLKAVSSRTFTNRSGRWRTADTAYILCHEEIQRQAVKMLGKNRLQKYRNRIHHWASDYHARKWPSDTPEYLFRGYFSLLRESMDLERLFSFSIDLERHERMLDIIGGDSVAINEVLSTLEILVRRAPSNLDQFCKLAVHRVSLMERNSHIPTYLPVVWAQLGRANRAEALARSIIKPNQQVRALVSIARELASVDDNQAARSVIDTAYQIATSLIDVPEKVRAFAMIAQASFRIGDSDGAHTLLSGAESRARSIPRNREKSVTLAAVARAYAAIGKFDHSLSIASSIPDRGEQDSAVAAIAVEICLSGDWEQALEISKDIKYWSTRAPLLSTIGHAALQRGARSRGQAIVSSALNLAGRIRGPERRGWAFASIARNIAEAGDRRSSHRISQKAMAALDEIDGEHAKADSLIAVVRSLMAAGSESEAFEIARGFNNPARQAKALAVIASLLASRGERVRAEELAIESEGIARLASDSSRKDSDLASLVQALGAVGDFERSEKAITLIHEVAKRDKSLTLLSEAIAMVGDLAEARRVVAKISTHSRRLKAQARMVRAVAAELDGTELSGLLESISDPELRSSLRRWISKNTRSRLFEASPDSGSDESESTGISEPGDNKFDWDDVSKSSSSNDLYRISREQTELAIEFFEDENLASGLAAIGSIVIPALRIDAMLRISNTYDERGNASLAETLINQAIYTCDLISNPLVKDRTISRIARQLAGRNDLARGEELAQRISSPPARQKSLASLSDIASRSGDVENAERIARSIQDSSLREKALANLAKNLAELALFGDANRVVISISDSLVKSLAMSSISVSLASHGLRAQSEELAAQISDVSIRSRTFASLAFAADRNQSGFLIVQALNSGHWSLCLPVLVKLAPRSVPVLADEFFHTIGVS